MALGNLKDLGEAHLDGANKVFLMSVKVLCHLEVEAFSCHNWTCSCNLEDISQETLFQLISSELKKPFGWEMKHL